MVWEMREGRRRIRKEESGLCGGGGEGGGRSGVRFSLIWN